MTSRTTPERRVTEAAEQRARFTFMLASTTLAFVVAFGDLDHLTDVGRTLLRVGLSLMVVVIAMSVAVVLPILRPRRRWLRVRLAQLALIGVVLSLNLTGWSLLLAGGAR